MPAQAFANQAHVPAYKPHCLEAAPAHPDTRADAYEFKDTLGGLVDALTCLPEWAGTLAFNSFDQRMVFRREPPFGGPSVLGEAVRDHDFDRIRLWFENEAQFVFTRSNLVAAARIVANRHAFHPVSEYLQSLRWDGVPRIDTWLEDFCAVRPMSEDHARLTRTVARKWLISCVARALRPGCKVDAMLILEGRQGIGKSTALAALAGDGFFCDSLIDFGTKEACQTIQGVWIYELPELDALLRRETSVIKGFLSRAVDRFRVPYGRAPESIPRSVVFCGTINHGGYLRDRTGNRRFWVTRCEDRLDTSGLRAARDSLWAEAGHRFDAGETWHLDHKDEALMREEHEDRLETDPWEDLLGAWTLAHGSVPFTMNALLESALGLSAQSKNPNVTSRVNHILENLGFVRRRTSLRGLRRYVYGRVRHEALPCWPTVPLEGS